jgi:hypothetical protein
MRIATPSLVRPALLALALLPSVACGGGPTGASAGSPASTSTVLSVSEVVLTRPGAVASVTATADGQAATVAYALAEESPAVAGFAVLDAEALARGEVRARAPGRAVLQVRAGTARPAELRVRVEPDRPVVLAAETRGGAGEDTLRLRGWELSKLEEVRIGGTAARIVGREAAALTAVVARGAEAACAGASAADTLRVGGAWLAADSILPRPRAGDVRLEVGAALRLDAEAARCLRLAPVAGARYALAFVDTRAARRAESGYEGAAPASAEYTVTVAEAGSTAPGFSAAPRYAMAAAAAHPRPSATLASGVFRRAQPWQAGERVDVPNAEGTARMPGRIARVYGGWLALAVADGALADEAAWLARADSAFAFFAADGQAVMRGALSATRPTSSAANGQLLVVAYRDAGGYLGFTAAESVDGRRHAYLYLGAQANASAASVLRTLAHEAAHAWQEQYAWETRPAGSPYGMATAAWGAEGGAELLASVAVARFLDVPLLGNWDWSAALGRPDATPFALLPAGARGDLTGGYAAGAGFLLDQAERLLRAGAGEADALAAVSRGAVDGWFGWDARGARRTGLAARMRPRLGDGWSPADALLGWAASQAVDDLTSNPALQNHTFLGVSTRGASTGSGWQPAAVLHSGAAARPGGPGNAVVVTGNAATLTWRHGSPAYVLIEDDGAGAAYRLAARAGGASLDGDVAWMLVRYR